MAHNPRHTPSEFRLSPPWNINHPLWGAEFRSQTMPFRYDPEDPPEFREETMPHRIDPGFDRPDPHPPQPHPWGGELSAQPNPPMPHAISPEESRLIEKAREIEEHLDRITTGPGGTRLMIDVSPMRRRLREDAGLPVEKLSPEDFLDRRPRLRDSWGPSKKINPKDFIKPLGSSSRRDSKKKKSTINSTLFEKYKRMRDGDLQVLINSTWGDRPRLAGTILNFVRAAKVDNRNTFNKFREVLEPFNTHRQISR